MIGRREVMAAIAAPFVARGFSLERFDFREVPRFANRKRYRGKFDLSFDVENDRRFIPGDLVHSMRGVIYLDGREIKQVNMADTEKGILRTFDVFGDGKPHATNRQHEFDALRKDFEARPNYRVGDDAEFDARIERARDVWVQIVDVTSFDAKLDWTCKLALGIFWNAKQFPGREVSCPPEGVLAETLRGRVEIWGPEEKHAAET